MGKDLKDITLVAHIQSPVGRRKLMDAVSAFATQQFLDDRVKRTHGKKTDALRVLFLRAIKSEEYDGQRDALLGMIAYGLTKRMTIDMPTARAVVDEAASQAVTVVQSGINVTELFLSGPELKSEFASVGIIQDLTDDAEGVDLQVEIREAGEPRIAHRKHEAIKTLPDFELLDSVIKEVFANNKASMLDGGRRADFDANIGKIRHDIVSKYRERLPSIGAYFPENDPEAETPTEG